MNNLKEKIKALMQEADERAKNPENDSGEVADWHGQWFAYQNVLKLLEETPITIHPKLGEIRIGDKFVIGKYTGVIVWHEKSCGYVLEVDGLDMFKQPEKLYYPLFEHTLDMLTRVEPQTINL